MDTYIGDQRDRSGLIFAFVRFKVVQDAKTLEMGKVRCGHYILKVNLACYKKQHGCTRSKANTSYTAPPTMTQHVYGKQSESREPSWRWWAEQQPDHLYRVSTPLPLNQQVPLILTV